MMKKPISVQFKFWESLNDLNAPTEPKISVVRTAQIPAQDQERLGKSVKRYRVPTLVPLLILAGALALIGCLFLAILYQ